jgi:YD repeat-containing protein
VAEIIEDKFIMNLKYLFSLTMMCLAWSLCHAQTPLYDAAGRLTGVRNPNGQIFYYQYDAAGNLLSVRTDLVVPVALASPMAARAGERVLIDISGGRPMGGHIYAASGLPAGLRIDPATGRITGIAAPGSHKITYWVQAGTQKSALQTVTLNVSGFLTTLAGSYDSLIMDPDAGTPVGRAEITLGISGTFTGKLLYRDAKSYPLSGGLAMNSDGTSATGLLSILRTGLTPLGLTLTAASDGSFVATLRTGNLVVGNGIEGRKRGIFSKTSPAAWAGTYTLALETANWSQGTPDGTGYASVKVAPDTGLMTFTGKTADGKPVTGSFPCSAAGVYLPWFNPHATAESRLAGWLKMVAAGGSPVTYRAVSPASALTWIKAAAPKDTAYPNGYGPLNILPTLLPWAPPAKGQTLAAKLGLPTSGEFGAILAGSGIDSTGTAVDAPALVPIGSNAFARRGAIPAAGGFAYANNTSATKEKDERTHAGRTPTRSVWWSWTPAVSGTMVIQTAGSTFDTVLAVYRGTEFASLISVVSNDDVASNTKTSRVSFSAAAGTTYHIVVDGHDSNARGKITLIVTPPASFSQSNSFGVPAWLKVSTGNKLAGAENSYSKLTGSVNPITGVFKGSFNVRALVTGNGSQLLVSKMVPFEGVFQQGASGQIGSGFFLLPPFSNVEFNRSGLCVFTPTPPRNRYP